MQQTNRPGAKHQCLITRPGVEAPHAEHNTRDRLDEGAFLEAQGVVYPVEVSGGYRHVLGQASQTRHPDPVPVEAVVSPIRLAEEALVTEDARVYCHSRAHLPACHPWAHFRHRAGKLMARYNGIRGQELAMVDVGVRPTGPLPPP